jgi:hypothetical protein
MHRYRRSSVAVALEGRFYFGNRGINSRDLIDALLISPDKSVSVADTWSRYRWLQANLIVHRVPQPLFAAKVTLRRLNAHVTE